MNLYELTGQYCQLLDMAEEGVFDQAMINDTLEGVGAEIEEKADSYAKIIRILEENIKCIDAEVERLSERKSVMKNNIASLKKNLENAMIATGKIKFKTVLFGFGIQKNAPSLDIVSEKDVPEEFWIQQPAKLDRKGALDFVKKNGDQPWGQLKQTESLRIR